MCALLSVLEQYNVKQWGNQNSKNIVFMSLELHANRSKEKQTFSE